MTQQDKYPELELWAGVELFTSDKCLGLVEALGEFYPEASCQRCIVHWFRNVRTAVPTGKAREVVAMLKAIHALEDRAAAEKKAADVISKLQEMKLGKAAKIVEEGVVETLSYMAFPREHWTRIRTNNPLERIMREIRRRTRVVRASPDSPARYVRGDYPTGRLTSKTHYHDALALICNLVFQFSTQLVAA